MIDEAISCQTLVGQWPTILKRIRADGTIYRVEDESVSFVIAPPSIGARVFGSVDPEYGWPVSIDVETLDDPLDITPTSRRHPVLQMNGVTVAVCMSAAEYEAVLAEIEHSHQINQLRGVQREIDSLYVGAAVDDALLGDEDSLLSFFDKHEGQNRHSLLESMPQIEGIRWGFSAGLPEAVSTSAASLLINESALSNMLIRRVSITESDADELHQLFRTNLLNHVHDLAYFGEQGNEFADCLRQSAVRNSIRTLQIEMAGLTDEHLQGLLQAGLPGVGQLSLRRNQLTAQAFRHLGECPLLPNLHSLNLSRQRHVDGHQAERPKGSEALILMKSANLPSLVSLNLAGLGMGADSRSPGIMPSRQNPSDKPELQPGQQGSIVSAASSSAIQPGTNGFLSGDTCSWRQ